MAKVTSMPPQDQTLPHNLDAERCVLGAIIRDPEVVTRAHEILGGDSFYQPSHKIIFDTILELYSNNVAIDLVTLSDALTKKEQIEKVGGPLYLSELVQSVVTSAFIEHHAQIVRERALRRRLIRSNQEIIAEAYQSSDSIETIITHAEDRMFKLGQQRSTTSFEKVGKHLDTAIEKVQIAHTKKGALTGLGSGFRDLDKMTAGFQSSDLIILAARPSVGKTSLVLNIADFVAMEGSAVGIFSLEMSSEQIAERVLCSQAKVDLKNLRGGYITKREASMLLNTSSRIKDIPLYVDDTPNLSPMEIASRAKRLKSEEPNLSLLIIDYLQLMSGNRRIDNRQQEVAEISRSLKILARDLDIPIIACSQLSRAVEKRDDQTPRLSDLRESGAIEQDADVVVFLHREPKKFSAEEDETEEDLEAGKEMQYIYKLIIGKHRNGPVGEVEIYFARQYTRFFDIARPESDDEVPF